MAKIIRVRHSKRVMSTLEVLFIFIPFKHSNDWGFWRALDDMSDEPPEYATERKGLWYKIPHEKYLELAANNQKKDD